MQYIFRRAREQDFDKINALIEQVHSLHADQRPDMYKKYVTMDKEEFRSLLRDTKNSYYVYEISDTREIAVYASMIAVEIKNDPVMVDNKIWMMDSLCVDKKYKRQGIGKSIMQEIEKIAKQEGFSRIDLNVWIFNRDAVQFYKQCGFKESRVRMQIKI